MNKHTLSVLTLLPTLFALSPLPTFASSTPSPTPTPTPVPVGSITVDMKNGKGESVGTAWISPKSASDKGIIIQLDLHGLPSGTHGIHIHEKGSCIGPDFKSSGSHFSPGKRMHGTMSKNGPHAGDLGNIEVTAAGTVQTKLQDDHVDLGVSMKSLQMGSGTALVIHAKADDNQSQPAGNSGDRIVCGEIHPLTK